MEVCKVEVLQEHFQNLDEDHNVVVVFEKGIF